MPKRLTDPERAQLAADLPGWTIAGESISRTFDLADFAAAMGFVTRVALAAERLDHHPDIDIRWNRVTIDLSTHSIAALSDLDRRLALTIDGFTQEDPSPAR